MVARRWVIVIGVVMVSGSLVALALTMSAAGKSQDYANVFSQDNSDNVANAIAPMSANDSSSSNQDTRPNDFNNSTGLASSSQTINNTAMPTESEWENWTTFELFEKYPILENLTSLSGNNNTTNETITQQSPSPQQKETFVQQGEESRDEALQQQNGTIGQSSANATNSTSSAMSAAPLARNASSPAKANLDNGTQAGSDIFASPIINNNININIYNNTNADKEAQRLPANATLAQQTSAAAIAAAEKGSSFDFTLSKRITGDLEKGDYVVLGHFAQYSLTGQHRQIQLKLPCNDDKEPKVKLLVGSVPNLKELDLGKAMMKASVEGSNDVTLSKAGEYCLYRADLPENTGDAILINDSSGTLHFSKMRYYVTIIDSAGQTN